MSELPKRYWMTVVQRDAEGTELIRADDGDPDFVATRRNFLKAAGFSLGALTVSACRGPEVDALPYVQQPEGIVPGRAAFYATTCGACEACCGVLVTTRDGRPLKIEGNPDHPFSGGSACAVGHASILGLYDSQRLHYPLTGGRRAAWADVDREITASLDRLRQEGRPIRIVTRTVTSPTQAAVIADFLAGFPNARHVAYDAISSSAILDAHLRTHGVRVLPQYRFDLADVIVSFDADFLGAWISPLQHMRGYANRRRTSDESPRKSYHVQIESRLSLTGSNADRRLRVAPGEIGHLATHLAALIARRAESSIALEGLARSSFERPLEDIADRLWAARGRALIVSGTQDARVQALCNLMNQTLGAYGTTIDIARPSSQRGGSDMELAALRTELARGEVGALIVVDANPVYDLPDAAVLAADLRRVPLVVCTSERMDETAAVAHFVCPNHHYLESWGDAEPVSGLVSLTQPVIQPLYDTRPALESLARWMGKPQSALELVREHWRTTVYPRAATNLGFDVFWDRTLERGVGEVAPRPAPLQTAGAVPAPILRPDELPADRFALVLYEKAGMLDGRHAHNAWLHELPDPVTKVTWGNYACVSPVAAARLNVEEGDVVSVTIADGPSIDLPVFVQPGQHDAVVAIALGYGRAGTDRFERVGPPWFGARSVPGLVGMSASSLVAFPDDARRYSGRIVAVSKTGKHQPLASTQRHYSLESAGMPAARPIIQEITLGDMTRTAKTDESSEPRRSESLWPDDHPSKGHRWGMVIDLNSCTGCSACVVACQAENNVPVVGQDEVRRNREMHWIRIDRYYSGADDDLEVAHQPMMCQHCEHAPCETVCPVQATTHSEEGLNEQVYNRCVGTRYCANNCPYKVRRFNWFDYPHDDRLHNLVFNPNVVVRSRGVMEKCTFCVQRIEEQKIEAKRLGRSLADGSIKTACEQSCPAQAIVFGDLHDSASRVSRLAESKRAYRVLEDLHTQPAVRYLKIVRHDRGTTDGSASG